MAGHTSKRLGVLGGLGIGLLGFGAIVAVGFSAGPSDQPDLEALLPVIRPTSRFTDTVQVPGKVLYRFDSVILNEGGALDVSRTSSSSPTVQTIFDGGDPNSTVSSTKDLQATGKIAYSFVTGHLHFHTQLAAGYELDTVGGTLVNKAAKNSAGFCLYDSYGQPPLVEIYANDCHGGDPGYTGAIREGISRGWGDFYGSDLGDQWVDVTSVAPGTYVLKARANPAGLYTESDSSDASNVTTATVVIPGATAGNATGATSSGKTVDVAISGTVVGADQVSRKLTAACAANSTLADPGCMTPALAGKLTFQIASQPAAGSGSVQIVDSTSDQAAVARYTAPANFVGTATFTYVTTDSRGLTSNPATVTVSVNPTAGTPPSGGGTGTPGTGGGTGTTPTGTAKATVKLKPAFQLLHSGGKVFLKVSGTLPKAQAGRLVRVQRKVGKRITTIGGIRVARTGRYSRRIRVHAATLSVRTSLGSSASTKAALSVFRRIT